MQVAGREATARSVQLVRRRRARLAVEAKTALGQQAVSLAQVAGAARGYDIAPGRAAAA